MSDRAVVGIALEQIGTDDGSGRRSIDRQTAIGIRDDVVQDRWAGIVCDLDTGTGGSVTSVDGVVHDAAKGTEAQADWYPCSDHH